MDLSSSLIVKLLIAAAAVTPAVGYGGYCAYDHCFPTFHKRLISKGFKFSHINWDWTGKETYRKDPSRLAENIGEDWICSKYLFKDIDTPVVDMVSTTDKDETLPTPPTNIETSSDDSLGCLVASLGHVKEETNKSAGFLKWELSLRSKERGFIYVGYLSVGNVEVGNTAQNTFYQQSDSAIFEVQKESNNWRIKNGLGWSEYLVSTTENFNNSKASISLPNAYTWNSGDGVCVIGEGEDAIGKCPASNKWTFERYVGFWKLKTNGDKQVTDAIKIDVKVGDQEKQHDIWSKTNFAFEKTTPSSSGGPTWENTVSHVYDATNKKWKITKADSKNAQSYLKAIYSPWANKKGTWMEAKVLCYESNYRHLGENDEHGKRIIDFCYSK